MDCDRLVCKLCLVFGSLSSLSLLSELEKVSNAAVGATFGFRV
jgi:hypothetical protein